MGSVRLRHLLLLLEDPHVHAKFKLKPEDIPNLQVIPPVPPLEK